MSILCIRGCIIRREHLAECPSLAEQCTCHCHNGRRGTYQCDVPTGCYEAHATPPECTGCLPRPATEGEQLCRGCKTSTIRALLSFGELAAWLRENVEPGTRGDAKDVNAVARAYAPLSIDALTDLDEIANLLAAWVRVGCEEYPGGLHGPDWRGARVAPATASTDSTGDRLYYPARVVGVRAGDDGQAIIAAAQWLTSFADWYAAQPWADSWHDELTKGARDVRARWPQVVRAKKAPLPCPKCGLVMLWFHPSPRQGWSASVICHTDGCDVMLTEEDFWIKVHEKRAEMEAA